MGENCCFWFSSWDFSASVHRGQLKMVQGIHGTLLFALLILQFSNLRKLLKHLTPHV